MVLVKKNTIDREAFELEMVRLATIAAQHDVDSPVIKEIEGIKKRLIKYVEEGMADDFRIPSWLTEED